MPKVETWRKRKGLKSIGLAVPPLSTMVVGDESVNYSVRHGLARADGRRMVPDGDIACCECGYVQHAPGCPKVKRDAETRQLLDDCQVVRDAVERAVCLIDARFKATAKLVDTGVWEFSITSCGERFACRVDSTTVLAYARGEHGASRLAGHVLDCMKIVGVDGTEASADHTHAMMYAIDNNRRIEALRKVREELKLKMEHDALTFSTYRLQFIKDDGAKW